MITGPENMPVFANTTLTPGRQAHDHRLHPDRAGPAQPRRPRPRPRRTRSLRAWSSGSSASACSPAPRCGSGRRSHERRTRPLEPTVRRPRRHGEPADAPGPARAPACGAPTSTRSRRSAPSARSLVALHPLDAGDHRLRRRVHRLPDAADVHHRSSRASSSLSASNFFLGMTLAVALLGIGIGAIHWAKKLMSDVEIVELRHPSASSAEDREEFQEVLDGGVESSGIMEYTLIRRTLIGAMAPAADPRRRACFATSARSPASLSSTRRSPRASASSTTARRLPLRPEDIPIGGLVNVVPETPRRTSRRRKARSTSAPRPR